MILASRFTCDMQRFHSKGLFIHLAQTRFFQILKTDAKPPYATIHRKKSFCMSLKFIIYFRFFFLSSCEMWYYLLVVTSAVAVDRGISIYIPTTMNKYTKTSYSRTSIRPRVTRPNENLVSVASANKSTETNRDFLLRACARIPNDLTKMYAEISWITIHIRWRWFARRKLSKHDQIQSQVYVEVVSKQQWHTQPSNWIIWI